MQKLVGTELYVFDLTPFEITQQTSDATVIFVQNECIDGYKELNTSLADKIKGFNQFTICVTDPWAGGVEPGPEPPTPTGHTLTFDVQGIELCRITDELDSDAGEIDNPTSPVNVEVGKYFKMFTNGYGDDHYEYYTITGVQATFVDSVNSYNSYPFFYFVMPDEDVTLSVTYEEPTPTRHTIEVTNWEGVSGMRLTTELDSDAGEVNPQEFPVANVEEGTYVKLWADPQSLETDQYYTITGAQATFVPASQSYNSFAFFYFVMPDEDVTLSVAYNPPTVSITYNVVDNTNEIPLFYLGQESGEEGNPYVGNMPDKMFIDGNEETVSSSWRFDTTGPHIVEYIFNDGVADLVYSSIEGTIEPTAIAYNENIVRIWYCAFDNGVFNSLDTAILATTPPEIFAGTNTPGPITATIYVPQDAVAAYQAAPVWSDANIQPIQQ